METRNIYQKIQDVKLELQKMDLKKSGKNSGFNFTYFELKDFLPSLVELMNKHGLFSKIDFKENEAVLCVVNAEKTDEFVEYTSPVSQLEIRGCNAIQALGGVQTYLRRYLYMNAFDIVQADLLDSITVDQKSDNRFEQAKTNTEFMMKHDSCDKRLSAIRTKHAFNGNQEKILRNAWNDYINK